MSQDESNVSSNVRNKRKLFEEPKPNNEKQLKAQAKQDEIRQQVIKGKLETEATTTEAQNNKKKQEQQEQQDLAKQREILGAGGNFGIQNRKNQLQQNSAGATTSGTTVPKGHSGNKIDTSFWEKKAQTPKSEQLGSGGESLSNAALPNVPQALKDKKQQPSVNNPKQNPIPPATTGTSNIAEQGAQARGSDRVDTPHNLRVEESEAVTFLNRREVPSASNPPPGGVTELYTQEEVIRTQPEPQAQEQVNQASGSVLSQEPGAKEKVQENERQKNTLLNEELDRLGEQTAATLDTGEKAETAKVKEAEEKKQKELNEELKDLSRYSKATQEEAEEDWKKKRQEEEEKEAQRETSQDKLQKMGKEAKIRRKAEAQKEQEEKAAQQQAIKEKQQKEIKDGMKGASVNIQERADALQKQLNPTTRTRPKPTRDTTTTSGGSSTSPSQVEEMIKFFNEKDSNPTTLKSDKFNKQEQQANAGKPPKPKNKLPSDTRSTTTNPEPSLPYIDLGSLPPPHQSLNEQIQELEQTASGLEENDKDRFQEILDKLKEMEENAKKNHQEMRDIINSLAQSLKDLNDKLGQTSPSGPELGETLKELQNTTDNYAREIEDQAASPLIPSFNPLSGGSSGRYGLPQNDYRSQGYGKEQDDRFTKLLRHIVANPQAQHHDEYEKCDQVQASYIMKETAACAKEMPLRSLGFNKRPDGTYNVELPENYTGPVLMPRLDANGRPVYDPETKEQVHDTLVYENGRLKPELSFVAPNGAPPPGSRPSVNPEDVAACRNARNGMDKSMSPTKAQDNLETYLAQVRMQNHPDVQAVRRDLNPSVQHHFQQRPPYTPNRSAPSDRGRGGP